MASAQDRQDFKPPKLFENHNASHLCRFSSYPGCISSTDDWVLGDNKVLITETTTSPQSENHGFLNVSGGGGMYRAP